MDNTYWMGKAIDKINSLETGVVFYLKDLFDGVEWKELPVGDRLGFGKYFKNEILENSVPSVRYSVKAQNNSAQYIKGE